MKIALVTGCEQSVPPTAYGGTERIVAILADELVDLGHDVTLYASGDSHTKAKLVKCTDQAIRTLPESNDANIRQALNIQALANTVTHIRHHTYDIIDNHAGWQLLLFQDVFKNTPMVTTLHNTIDKDSALFSAEYYMYDKLRHANLVSISDNQRHHHPALNYVATIHHGLPIKKFTFNAKPKDYLLFLGRIHPSKGPDQAIQIALQTGQKLILAARLDDPDIPYYEQHIKPYLDNKQIKYVGEVDEQTKIDLLKDARALLSPLRWDEPFGVVSVESLACGTPVLSMRRGSLPEIIDDGVTGFLCDNVEQLAARVSDIDKIDRHACRDAAEKRFNAPLMANRYVQLFQKLTA